MRAVCTIITKNYIHYAQALHQSILKFKDIPMHALVVDEEIENSEDFDANFHLYDVSVLKSTKTGREVFEKYYNKNLSIYRWVSKSSFMVYLLSNHAEELLYLDGDLFFYEDPGIIFEIFSKNDLILNPHFRCSDPSVDYYDFGRNNTHGLFNAGFIGATKGGTPALKWLEDVCLKNCEKNIKKGYYFDQSHLNLIPILFDKVGIIKNRGCDVASWNRHTCARSLVDETLFLNKTDQLIFIHFTHDTIKGILDGSDPLLLPHLKEYAKALATNKSGFNLLKKFSPSFRQKVLSPKKSKHIQNQIASIS